MPPKTITFHAGSKFSRGHNIRDPRYTDEQKHIDRSLSVNNEVICDEPVREAYQRIFGEAQDEYNARQRRADRRIDDYYIKVRDSKVQHPVYEVLVQIGDKDDTGNAATEEKAVLREFAQTWNERNPNLHMIGAYIHADEPNGTVHMHLDYIPVADCTGKRGMRLQNSYVAALGQQGFVATKASETAQMMWEDSQRECLEEMCRQHGISAKANQGLTHTHLSVKEYQRAKDRQNEQIKGELSEEYAQEIERNKELKQQNEQLVRFTHPSKTKTVKRLLRTVEVEKTPEELENDKVLLAAKAVLQDKDEAERQRRAAEELRQNIEYEIEDRAEKRYWAKIKAHREQFEKEAEKVRQQQENEFKGQLRASESVINELKEKLNIEKELSSMMSDAIQDVLPPEEQQRVADRVCEIMDEREQRRQWQQNRYKPQKDLDLTRKGGRSI